MTTNVYRQTSNSEEQLLSQKKGKTFKTLRGLRSKHPKNAFLGHLHVNSL